MGESSGRMRGPPSRVGLPTLSWVREAMRDRRREAAISRIPGQRQLDDEKV
jgi:hypothetical protein